MSSIVIAGDTSGSVTLQAPAVSGSSVLSLPAVTDTVAGIAATQTLTNKTLTAPILTAPVLGTPASGNLSNCTGIPAGSAATPTALGTVYGKTNTGSATAIGYEALASTTTAENVGVGYRALYANTSGASNTAVGHQSSLNSVGNNNSSFGYQSLPNNQASYNTAVGQGAGYANTTGESSVFIGQHAGRNATTGGSNTIIGTGAGYTGTALTTGYNNIYVGTNAAAASAAEIYSIVVGQNSTSKGNSTGFINPQTGGVYQGNNSTLWSVTSDQRLKKNIVNNNIGLEKLTQIQVRNFEYRTEDEITELPKDQAIKKSGIQLGVIAQELQAILPECVKTESTGVMSVDADNLTWYMINAIKEQQALITTLTERITALEGA